MKHSLILNIGGPHLIMFTHSFNIFFSKDSIKPSARCWVTKAEKIHPFLLSQSSLSSGGGRQTNRLLQCSTVSAKTGRAKGAPGAQQGD